MSSTPPQGQESISFDKQKDLDCTEASVPPKKIEMQSANQRLAEFKEQPKIQLVSECIQND